MLEAELQWTKSPGANLVWVRLPATFFPKIRLMSWIAACLKLRACLLFQRSTKLDGSAAKVLTKSMSEMCMTRET